MIRERNVVKTGIKSGGEVRKNVGGQLQQAYNVVAPRGKSTAAVLLSSLRPPAVCRYIYLDAVALHLSIAVNVTEHIIPTLLFYSPSTHATSQIATH